MKLSNSFFFTKREDSKDEESVSANLLVRAGAIKKVGSGIYSFLPYGFKILQNIERIVRDEMDATGCQELVMPSILPEDVYVASGRREVFGNDMFSLKDRFNRDYVLGPTHEELFLEVAREAISSYKDMPISLYQMANKYRDEPRSRYGLIRVREFIMKDAYSFDADEEGLDKSYKMMFDAYKRIFDKVGLNYRIVRASTGAMGGSLSEEFQAVCDIGEDTLVLCDNCSYSSNIEIGTCAFKECNDGKGLLEKELFNTPNVGTISDLMEKYDISAKNMVKTLIYKIDDKFYACLVRGDHDINEDKLLKLIGGKEISLATPEEDQQISGAKVGFAGPIGLDIPIVIDREILNMKNFLVGANKTDYHYINTNLRDFSYDLVGDIRNVTEDDLCPICGGKLHFEKGIEVGNTFKLGTKYSKNMNFYYTDKDNKQQPVVMGSYGIGVARILAALVEQNHDDKGMILPDVIAPYKVAIVIVNVKDNEQVELANSIYSDLKDNNIDVLLDDRDVRVGVKFKDMDLIGIPKRITIGKKVSSGIVEYKLRMEDEFSEINVKDILEKVI